MKKSLIAALLAALQCACSTQAAVVPTENVLLGFAQIAGEITVAYEKLDAEDIDDEALAYGPIESP